MSSLKNLGAKFFGGYLGGAASTALTLGPGEFIAKQLQETADVDLKTYAAVGAVAGTVATARNIIDDDLHTLQEVSEITGRQYAKLTATTLVFTGAGDFLARKYLNAEGVPELVYGSTVFGACALKTLVHPVLYAAQRR